MQRLRQIERAAATKAAQHARLVDLVVDAVNAGEPVTDVAAAARVSRVTVYAWVREDAAQGQRGTGAADH